MSNMYNLLSVEEMSLYLESSEEQKQQYRDVIYTSERELLLNPRCVKNLTFWIKSYHALSNIYLQDGDMKMAHQCLFIPHRSILHMAKFHQGDYEQKYIAKHLMQRTLPPILELSRQSPPCDNCIRDLEAQRRFMVGDETEILDRSSLNK